MQVHFRKTSIALAAMAICGAAQAAPTNLAFKTPANNATLSGSIHQSPACELTGSGIRRVEFFLDGTKLNTENNAPWNCNLDTRKFADGAHVLKAVAYDSSNRSAATQISVSFNNNGGTVTNPTTPTSPSPAPSYAGTPYSGTPIALPKAFAAVEFDKGGQNVAYRDLTNGNSGGRFRTSEDVDIIASSDSISPYAINGIQSGEWLAYTVNVPADGTYDLAVKASTNYSKTPAFRIEVDGTDVTGKINVPGTGNWDGFQWVGKEGVPLAKGTRVLKVISEAEYFNLAALSVLASATSAPAPSTPPPATGGPIVSFGSPINNQTVAKSLSGSTCEVFVASDAALRNVEFFLDGAKLNTEYNAPWNCSIDTTKLADGNHALKAVATDANGKAGASEITIKVANNTSAPAPVNNGPANVKFVTPAAGATISSDIYQSSACEVTGDGITGVQFFLDDKPLNTEGSAPWNCNLSVKDHANGAHKLRAIASDAKGGKSEVAIDVTIANGISSGGSTTSPVPSTGGGLQFSCSFENAPADCGFYEQAKVSGRATLVSTSREGSKAVQLHTEPGDSGVSGSGSWERNDLSLGQTLSDCSEGKEAWWAHSVLFPDGYNLPNSGGVVMDFHHTGSSGQANFHVDAMSYGLRLRGYGGNSVDSGRYEVTLGPVVKNQWYDFVYHVKWSSGSDGFMHAWVNGVKKLTHYGPTLYKGMGCYLKLANYHDAMGKSSSVIHDRVRRGSSAADVSLTPLN